MLSSEVDINFGTESRKRSNGFAMKKGLNKVNSHRHKDRSRKRMLRDDDFRPKKSKDEEDKNNSKTKEKN